MENDSSWKYEIYPLIGGTFISLGLSFDALQDDCFDCFEKLQFNVAAVISDPTKSLEVTFHW